MLAPMIKWDHAQDYKVAKFDATKEITSERKVTISLREEDHQYMAGHIIDGMFHEYVFYKFSPISEFVQFFVGFSISLPKYFWIFLSKRIRLSFTLITCRSLLIACNLILTLGP